MSTVDLDMLERDLLNDSPPRMPSNTPPLPCTPSEQMPLKTAMPEVGAVSQIGQFSAEAVMRDWETAAKQIEAMGNDLTGVAAKCEEASRDVLDTVRFVNETAALYRQEARKVFRRIEQRLIMTDHVRKACVDLRARLSSDPDD